jgi:hypothetical protein
MADDKKPKKLDRSEIDEEERRLQDAVDEKAHRAATTKFEGDKYSLPNIFGWSMGGRLDGAVDYQLKPDHVKPSELTANSIVWRVEFHNLKAGKPPLGVDIAGDVVLGRSAGGPHAPDIDFDEYDARAKGVSRRHALLRPTKNRLYILDLGSTNGTMRNAVPLGKGVARPVENDDTITLGRLSFTIKLVAGPGDGPSPAVEEASGDPSAPAGMEGIVQNPAVEEEAELNVEVDEKSARSGDTRELSEEEKKDLAKAERAKVEAKKKAADEKK